MNVNNNINFNYNQDKDSFYNQDFIDDSIDNDMISGEEAGFMQGYLGFG